MASCDRLTEIADKQRAELAALNAYQNSNGKQYNASHPNATQETGGNDDPLNIKGKGTGTAFDTVNGGGYYDINGRADVNGSGRNAHYTNEYNLTKHYDCVIDL